MTFRQFYSIYFKVGYNIRDYGTIVGELERLMFKSYGIKGSGDISHTIYSGGSSSDLSSSSAGSTESNAKKDMVLGDIKYKKL